MKDAVIHGRHESVKNLRYVLNVNLHIGTLQENGDSQRDYQGVHLSTQDNVPFEELPLLY